MVKEEDEVKRWKNREGGIPEEMNRDARRRLSVRKETIQQKRFVQTANQRTHPEKSCKKNGKRKGMHVWKADARAEDT